MCCRRLEDCFDGIGGGIDGWLPQEMKRMSQVARRSLVIKGGGLVLLAEFAPILAYSKWNVSYLRWNVAKKLMKAVLRRGLFKEISAADDACNSLFAIISDNSEVISVKPVLAFQHQIARALIEGLPAEINVLKSRALGQAYA